MLTVLLLSVLAFTSLAASALPPAVDAVSERPASLDKQIDAVSESLPPIEKKAPSPQQNSSATTPAKPVSADTVGPAPAQMPSADDIPKAADVQQKKDSPKIQLFGTVEFKRPLESLPIWLELLKKNMTAPIFSPQKQFNKKTTWEQFQSSVKGKAPAEMLRMVNRFWNTWPYREDIVNWGQQDYWAIPEEFLKKSGDCEDYAIIKYFTLKELGIPPEQMRIVVLRDTIRNLGHAVLVVYLDDNAYVLDNLSDAVLAHTRFTHYSPQYSINEFSRWAHIKGRKLK